MFEKILYAGWGDMDFNSHMKNTAYLDKSADVRMMFFAEHGFPMQEFLRIGIGPVVMKDEIVYYKEIGLLEEITVSLLLAGLADDGTRFILRNDFRKKDGKPAATVISTGGWLDLKARQLTAPPPELLAALGATPQTEDFRILPSSLKPGANNT